MHTSVGKAAEISSATCSGPRTRTPSGTRRASRCGRSASIHVGEAGWGVAPRPAPGHLRPRRLPHDPPRAGGTTTTLRLSLLRGPALSPTPRPTRASTGFELSAVHPGASLADAVRAGAYRTNLPMRTVTPAPNDAPASRSFAVAGGHTVIETPGSSSPTTQAATSSSGCTSRSGATPRARSHLASPPPSCARSTSWNGRCGPRAARSGTSPAGRRSSGCARSRCSPCGSGGRRIPRTRRRPADGDRPDRPPTAGPRLGASQMCQSRLGPRRRPLSG